MSRTYLVGVGDTFDLISRRSYGSEGFASLIRSANPEASSGLVPGTVLIIPDTNSLPVSNVPTAAVDEVAVSINGKRFRFWSTVSLSLSMDTIDRFSLTAPFDPENALFVESFVPMKFAPVSIFVGGVPLFTGTMVDVVPVTDAANSTVSASGYARCGVLNDVAVPAGNDLLEYDGMNLQAVTDAMVAPFGLASTFEAEAGAAYTRIAAQPSERILSFLTKQAKQHTLVLTNDAAGQLLFWQTAPGAPVADLEASPVLSVTPNFDPQNYWSSLTAIAPGFIGTDPSQSTLTNPRLPDVLRPMTFTASDTFAGDAPGAAAARLGRMFANAIGYDVELAGWVDPAGALWRPNTRVRLLAPRAMVYNPTEFLIRSVDLAGTPSEGRTRLGLVLPGSFEGQIPERLPWEAS